MRTTVTLADDVRSAVDRLRRERSIGLSEAINELVRAGLASHGRRPARFRQKVHDLGQGPRLDNIADILETLDGPSDGDPRPTRHSGQEGKQNPLS